MQVCLKPYKSIFGVWIISKKDMEIMEEKIVKMIKFFPLTTPTKSSSFMELATFSKSFINEFEAIAIPLHELTPKKTFNCDD